MPNYRLVDLHFRLAKLRASALLIVSVAMVWTMVPIHGFTQTSGPAASTTPAKETTYQRWIPSDESPRDPMQILQKLGKTKQSMRDAPPAQPSSRAPSTSDAKKILDKLPELTPSQKERLRRMAEQYVKEGNPPVKPEDLQKLPPELLEQMKKSPELQEIAKQIAQQSISREAGDPDASGKAEDPFAPVEEKGTLGNSPNESSLKQKDAPNFGGNPNRPPTKNSNSTQTPESSQNPAPFNKPNGDATAPAQNLPSQGSTSPKGGDREQTTRPLVQPSASSTPTLPRPNSSGTPTVDPRKNGTRPKGTQPEIQPGLDRNTSTSNSAKKSTSANTPIPTYDKPTESAVETIQRKFRELGFGNTLEKIAKEAAGLEQRENVGPIGRRDFDLPPNTRSENKRSNQPSGNSLPNVSQSPPTPRNDSWRSSTNKSAPSATPPTASNRNTSRSADSSTFELPKLELPKIDFPSSSTWWIIGIAAILALGASLWFLSRDPVIAAKVFGNKQVATASIAMASKNIRNRSDVVEAFHLLIESRFRSFEQWWTSRKALEQVDTDLPSLSPPMREAAEVYEKARYLPLELELSEQELERMRQAIKACSLAGGIS